MSGTTRTSASRAACPTRTTASTCAVPPGPSASCWAAGAGRDPRPLLLSETGLPNRFYIPAEDVRQDLLEHTDTHTVCPYKGTASYWSVRAGDHELTDAVWSYPQAGGDSAPVSGYLSFLHDDLVVEAGQPEPRYQADQR